MINRPKRLSYLFQKNGRYNRTVHNLQTPLDKAVQEINKRRSDQNLVNAVREYLNNDIPPHFDQNLPVFYLSRHIATPNEETMRFMQLCRSFDPSIPIVIGQDTEDIFVGNNILKHNLGKLKIQKGYNKNHQPIYEHQTIINFSDAQGIKLKNIETVCNISLIDFHAEMLNRLRPTEVEIADESEWVSRNHRGDLLEHYKKFLALLIVHGIMFEFYEEEDRQFVFNILIPAYKFVQKKFGCKPLITFLVDPTEELEKDWNAYPSSVQPYVENCLSQTKRTVEASHK